jgi:transcriptional regulator with XRE-family HTH domain
MRATPRAIMGGVNTDLEQVIGQRIRDRRGQLGLSQAALGRAVGARLGREWTRQAVCAAEKGGRAFTAAELCAIAGALGMTVTQLLGEAATAAPELRSAAPQLRNHVEELARAAAAVLEDATRLRLAALTADADAGAFDSAPGHG